MRIATIFLAAMFLSGCPKSRALDNGPMVEAAAPIVQPSASTKNVPLSKASTEIATVVHEWNDATNAHDSKKLGTLYADEVELYGQKVSRTKAMSIKEAAFAKHDHDDISDLTVMATRALFTKKSRAKNGNVIQVTGYIDVDASTKIVAEGDNTTDMNLARKKQDDCASAMGALVESTPEGKGLAGTWLRQIAGSADGWAVEFLMVHTGDPNGDYSRIEFHVDPATATVTTPGGNALVPDPAVASRVRALCK